MDFKKLQQRAVEIRKKYREFELKKVGKSWNREQLMEGFVVDIGELMEIVMAKEGWRQLDNVDEKLKHELSDCLWSLLVLADHYDVDLETSFLTTMNSLEKRIADKVKKEM